MRNSFAALGVRTLVVVHGKLYQQTPLNMRQPVLLPLPGVLQHRYGDHSEFSNDRLAYLRQYPVLQRRQQLQ